MRSEILAIGTPGLTLRSSMTIFTNRPFDGLRGYIECLPGAKEMGVIYGAGAWQLGDIQKNPAMQEAYQMGKNIC